MPKILTVRQYNDINALDSLDCRHAIFFGHKNPFTMIRCNAEIAYTNACSLQFKLIDGIFMHSNIYTHSVT